MSNNRWNARKGLGQFQPRSELSQQQQTLLAAVPRWKLTYVRPTHLLQKPHLNPSFRVRKWVIDTSSEAAEGTAAEMEAALAVVASGEVVMTDVGNTPVPSAGVSGAATPVEREGAEGGAGKEEGRVELIKQALGNAAAAGGSGAGVAGDNSRGTETPAPNSGTANTSGSSTPAPLANPHLPPPPAINPTKPSSGPAEIVDGASPAAPVAAEAVSALRGETAEDVAMGVDAGAEEGAPVEDEVALAGEALVGAGGGEVGAGVTEV